MVRTFRNRSPLSPGLMPGSSNTRQFLFHEFSYMEQIPIATGEFAYGLSLSALGPVMLPNERLLNELNVPKGKPRMRPLIRCPDIVPCASASRRAGMETYIR